MQTLIPNVIDKARAEIIRAECAAESAWVDTQRGPNGWASYRPEDKPACVPDVPNADKSALEVFDFVFDPPAKYFLYINETDGTATTWTGDKLGRVVFGREYRDNFGGRRVPVRVYGINGLTYTGTYYKSSGDYARVKLCKGEA